MGKNLESICMEGQSNIFTFDLIFFWVSMSCRGFLHSVNGIFKSRANVVMIFKSYSLDHVDISERFEVQPSGPETTG